MIQRANKSPDCRFAVSLVEMLIVIMIFMISVAAIHRIITTGTRGARHKQETVDHIRTAATLFRLFERDLRGLIPWELINGTGKIDKIYKFSPISTPEAAFSFTFRSFNATMDAAGLSTIVWSFDPVKKETRRAELDASGQEINVFRFGSGYCESFHVQDSSGSGKFVKVNIILGGGKTNIKQTSFERTFLIGPSLVASEAQNWVYHIK